MYVCVWILYFACNKIQSVCQTMQSSFPDSVENIVALVSGVITTRHVGQAEVTCPLLTFSWIYKCLIPLLHVLLTTKVNSQFYISLLVKSSITLFCVQIYSIIVKMKSCKLCKRRILHKYPGVCVPPSS